MTEIGGPPALGSLQKGRGELEKKRRDGNKQRECEKPPESPAINPPAARAKISPKLSRLTTGGTGAGTATSSAKISGSSPALIQRSLPGSRISFSRIRRPSRFHSRNSSRSTGPYSLP